MRKASALLDLAPSVAKAPLADALRVKKQGVCREEVGAREEIGRKSLPHGTSRLPPAALEGRN